MTDIKNDLKTGTTTVGLIFEGGVVLAADMRASMGHLAYDEQAEKVYKITDKIGLTNAGSVGDSLVLIRFLRSHAQLYETEREISITPKALASYLSNVLNNHRYYPYSVQFLLGGLNSKPEIHEITAFGGVLERDKYAVTGSGTEFAMSVLDQQYSKNLTEEQAIALAVRAIKASTKRDMYSGGESITVRVIDGHGNRMLLDKDVQKHIAKLTT
jgi:proteasome beta subunit